MKTLSSARAVLILSALAVLLLLLVLIPRPKPPGPGTLSTVPPADKEERVQGTQPAELRSSPPSTRGAQPGAGLPTETGEGDSTSLGVPAVARAPADQVPAIGPGATSGRRLVSRPGSKMRIEGTSNVHDWQVEGNIIGGTIELGPDFPLDPGRAATGSVEAVVSVSIPVRSMKSVEKDGRPFNARMDEILYQKLLEDTHRAIKYSLTELSLREIPANAKEPFGFEAKGALMVAGSTNVITMPVKMAVLPQDRLRFSGAATLRMTDFGIQPPEPLGLGIKTGDEVRVSFDWVVGVRR